MSDEAAADLQEALALSSPERRAVLRYAAARVAMLHREIEQPRDEDTTNRLRGQIMEARRLAQALEA